MPIKDFEDFTNKYGTPLSILIGAMIIAGSIFFSLNPDFKLGNFALNNTAPTAPTGGTGTPQPVAAPGPIQNIATNGLPVLGKANAPVTVVEFADFQCPFCGRFFKDTMAKLKTDYIDTGKVKFYYSDFAFLGAESFTAGQAAKCAQDQGKFWQYHDYLYNNQNGENQGAFAVDNLKTFAGSLGLSQTQFNSCMDSKKYEQAVKDETERAKTYGVNATPTSFVNGEMVRGAVPYDTLKAKI